MKPDCTVHTITHPLLGKVSYQLASNPRLPGTVVMVDEFEHKNIQIVMIPFLSEVRGGPPSGRIRIHQDAAPSLVAILAELHISADWPELLTWDGAYSARLQLGSMQTLSAHALGFAVDLNRAWNRIGTRGPAAGEAGNLENVARHFLKHGWLWGRDFPEPDPAHFEYAGVPCKVTTDR